MIDDFDYKEPSCALCGGKEFYNPELELPKGRIPVPRIIEKVNAAFDKNDYEEAGNILEYWEKEAVALGDENGELSVQSELIGYYRKTAKKEKAEAAIKRAFALIEKLDLLNTVSDATITLNAATAKKAFGDPQTAIKFYEKARKIYDKTLDKNDYRFAGLFNNAALAYVDVKNYDEAEKLYSAALDVMKNVADGEPDSAITYVNMAHLYYDKSKDKEKVVECLFNAYGLLTKENIKENGYLAYVLEKCAPSYGFFGFDFIEKEFKERSAKLYERT